MFIMFSLALSQLRKPLNWEVSTLLKKFVLYVSAPIPMACVFISMVPVLQTRLQH
jgi:hypothetical protein